MACCLEILGPLLVSYTVLTHTVNSSTALENIACREPWPSYFITIVGTTLFLNWVNAVSLGRYANGARQIQSGTTMIPKRQLQMDFQRAVSALWSCARYLRNVLHVGTKRTCLATKDGSSKTQVEPVQLLAVNACAEDRLLMNELQCRMALARPEVLGLRQFLGVECGLDRRSSVPAH